MKREIYESVRFISTGYSSTAQARNLQYSGEMFYSTFGTGSDQGLGTLTTSDLDYSYSDTVDSLIISGANVSYYAGSGLGVPGGFLVRANWTDNREVEINIIDELWLEDDAGVVFDRGSLVIRHGDDNILVFNADTGDVETVEITITEGGATTIVIEAWSQWSDSFKFYSVTGF